MIKHMKPDHKYIDEPYADEIMQIIKKHGDTTLMACKTYYCRLHVKNQTGIKIELACGEKEYVLQPEEEIDVGIMDGDCMYLDE